MKKRGDLYPVYLLYGPEDFLMEEENERLLDKILSPKERGLNLHVFSGEEHSAQEIVQAAQTLPMFSQYRFVVVKEADQLEEDKVKILLRYIENPSPSTCLVLQGLTLGPWRGHQAEIERVGKVVEFSRLRGKSLMSWLRSKMAEKGKTLSEAAADYLVEMVGDNLFHLESALEKAFLMAGERRTVELSDIDGMVADIKLSTVFDLTDAISRQDVEKALGVLDKVMGSKALSFRKNEEATKMGDPIPLLLNMMARQYRLIWRAKVLKSREAPVGEVVKELRMSPWMVKSLIDQSRNFSEFSLREGILKCHRTDLAVKRGRGPKELLMEKLVIDLCRPSEARAGTNVSR
jgi:DNA polymerase-3 subunit delta